MARAKKFDREKYLSIGYAGVKPTRPVHVKDTDRAPKGAHISTSLPRFTPYHRGEFTKKGMPIIRNSGDIEHIEKASNGRYRYD